MRIRRLSHLFVAVVRRIILLCLSLLAVLLALSNVEAEAIYLPLILRNYSMPYYKATFDAQQCEWGVLETIDLKVGCVNGEYQMLLKQANKNVFTIVADTLGEPDFALTADVRFDTNNYGRAGLIFGNTAGFQFYKFLIWPNPGVFGLYKSNGETLVAWQTHPAVSAYPAVNHLKIEREGAAIRLYANDQLLTTVNDNSIVGSGIGVYSNSDNQANVDTRYDNFIAYPLK